MDVCTHGCMQRCARNPLTVKIQTNLLQRLLGKDHGKFKLGFIFPSETTATETIAIKSNINIEISFIDTLYKRS